jgi:secondary thiamine-phosphate synthase enzyme
VNVFIKHTTAAITTADLDPGTDQDFIDFLNSLVPNIQWQHPHNPEHAPDHLLSSLIGPGVSVPVKEGKLQTGTWQRIILVELDGPREREIEITPLD